MMTRKMRMMKMRMKTRMSEPKKMRMTKMRMSEPKKMSEPIRSWKCRGDPTSW